MGARSGARHEAPSQDCPKGDALTETRTLTGLLVAALLQLVSRAMCLACIVASPRLLESRARTIEQMRLMNALCRFAEMAGGADGLGSRLLC